MATANTSTAKKSAAKNARPATKATPAAKAAAKSAAKASGDGTKAKPWKLKTPPGTSEYVMYVVEDADPPAIVCVVGTTELRYHRRAIDDLHAMLKQAGDWVPLGSAILPCDCGMVPPGNLI